MKSSYFTIFGIILLFILTCCNISESQAGVYFIKKTEVTSTQADKKPCILAGYKLTASYCAKNGGKL